uniref:FG-GAP repeat protein n=1 Tax=Pithovirus LCPAC104 TaxID=2506589 RepID=A0A481Z7C7_9VIRU|nr:MAG: FG-GAP repeat protein [Pithovirus LCPAC104]
MRGIILFSFSVFLLNFVECILIENQKLHDGTANNFFGQSLSIYKDKMVIGAPEENIQKGLVFIYENSLSEWNLVKNISNSNTLFLDYFGTSVILDEYLYISSPGFNNSEGEVYIYETKKWNQLLKLTASDGHTGNMFGLLLEKNKNHLAVVSEGICCSNFRQVYIFSIDKWIEVKKLTNPGDGIFGTSISMSNRYLTIGSPNSINNHVYIYDVENNFQFIKELLTPNYNIGFGISIFINKKFLLVGNPYYQPNPNEYYRGRVHVYDTKEWNLIDDFVGSNIVDYDRFGYSISGNENYILVSAPGKSLQSYSTGVVYLFNTGTWKEREILIPKDYKYNYFFGSTLTVYKNTIAVGNVWLSQTSEFAVHVFTVYNLNFILMVFVLPITSIGLFVFRKKIIKIYNNRKEFLRKNMLKALGGIPLESENQNNRNYDLQSSITINTMNTEESIVIRMRSENDDVMSMSPQNKKYKGNHHNITGYNSFFNAENEQNIPENETIDDENITN